VLPCRQSVRAIPDKSRQGRRALKQFAEKFDEQCFLTYRNGVRDLANQEKPQHENLLPGLLLEDIDCGDADRRLIEAELSGLANDTGDETRLLASLTA
jgi:hypothetical protein